MRLAREALHGSRHRDEAKAAHVALEPGTRARHSTAQKPRTNAREPSQLHCYPTPHQHHTPAIHLTCTAACAYTHHRPLKAAPSTQHALSIRPPRSATASWIPTSLTTRHTALFDSVSPLRDRHVECTRRKHGRVWPATAQVQGTYEPGAIWPKRKGLKG